MHRHLIAVIDDDVGLRNSIGDLLRAYEFDVALFFSVDAFLRSITSSRFDCLIADIYMPGTSTLSLVKNLRESGHSMPVILITGIFDEHLDDIALDIGAQCLLRKPLERSTLLEQLTAGLSQKRE
jgi:two-component system, LuxR family, response regulator FixJ